MAYSFKQRKDGGFDFFDATGKKTNIESYTKNTGANINQLRQKLATQGDTQSQRIVAGLPTQFRAPTQQQSTPSVFNTPIVRTPTMSQTVSQPTIQAPKVYTPKAQQAYVDAKIIGTGSPNEVKQAITRTVDRKNSVKLDPQFKQGKSYEDIARDAGFSIDEVKRYAERNHKGYGDLGLIGNAARATGQFVGTTVDNGVGIVRKPISTLALIDSNNQQKINDDLSQINKDLYYRNITPKAAQERASALTKDLIGMKATQDQKTGMYRLGDMNTAEFTGQFAQQGIDSASLLPVAGGAASGSARIASALGNKTAANTLNKAASVMTAGAQTQATSKLANALAARGINPQTANLIGNAVTSNAKQSLVYGSAQTGADVASGRGITPESLAMNYGADFLMGAVPEIGLGSIGRGIDLNNTKVHQELVRTNPTYKANTDKLTGIDATIARAQANGDIRALEGLQAVKAQLSDSNALIARRYAEQGFLGGKNATGFKDAEARGEVFDGVDGKPRFEVDDSGAKIKNPNGNTLGEMLEHPELFKNYPDLTNIKTTFNESRGRAGAYNPNGDSLNLSDKNDLRTLLHETQHAIQTREGFDNGTTIVTGEQVQKVTSAIRKSDANIKEIDSVLRQVKQATKGKKLVGEARAKVDELKKLRENAIVIRKKQMEVAKKLYSEVKTVDEYKNNLGEAEARAVEARMDMPMSERYVKPETLYHGTGKNFKQFGINAETKQARADIARLNAERGKLVESGKVVDNSLTIPPQAQKRIAQIDKEIEVIYQRPNIMPSSVKEKGVYLTSDKNYAKTFAGKDGNILETSADIKNPYIIKNKDEMDLIEDAAYYPQIIKNLEAEGYDSIKSPDGQVLVFDPAKVKLNPKPRSTFYDSLDVPKEDLIIRNDGGKAMSIEDPTAALKAEALKYKTAEEFIKAQGEPLYHGSPNHEVIRKNGFKTNPNGNNLLGEGVYLTRHRSKAENYSYPMDLADRTTITQEGRSAGVVDAYIPKGTKIFQPESRAELKNLTTKDLQNKGYGGVEINGETVIFDSAKIKTKEQLTDLYNQAHAQSQAPVAQPKVEAPQPKIEAPKQPTAFELDLKKAGLGVEPDAYRKQPKDVKKAIDTYIANENPQLAYALDSKLHFPDGIPKVRPEDVKRITGLTPREAGIPPIYVSRNATPIDKLAVEYEITVRGNTSGELKMTSEDFLDTMMDAIEADRSVGQQTKLIRELRNNPEVIAKARATLEAERAQYGTPEVVEPSKSDVAFLNRVDKQRIEQDVTTHKAKLQEINKKIREEKPRNPVLPTYKTKQVGIIDKVFRSTRSIIERQGESGKKLAEALQDQRTNKELWIRHIEKQIPTVMKLKGKEFENFIDATQGNARPLNDNVSKAIGEWRSTHPEIRQRGLDAGLNIGDLGETYYPHFIDYDKIYKDKNTYNEAINHLVTTKQAETPEAAIALLGRARDISRNREFGNLEASRIIDLPFYDRSKNTLASYINSSADRITKAEVFGKSDEKALALIKQIGLEGGDTEAAKNAFDVAVGAKQYNHTASKVSGGIRQYITTTRLGLGALTNVSQNVNTGVVTGHLRTMGAIFKQLDPKTRQWAADTGVISDAIINDLRRGYGAETFGNKKLGKVVNATTAPGFATVEKFNRRVAATAGKDYALRLAQKGDAKSISTLRKLGVEGEINGTLTDAQQVQAARKIVEKTQFKVDAQDLPGWTDSPGGKLVSQFRTFSYSQAKFFSNEVLKPAAKGNLMPLARVLAALPVGYALYETRRMIDGRPEEDDKSKVALSSFQKIGGAGLALDIYLGMNPVGSKYLPSDRRVSMAVGTLGGPSAGIAADAVGSLSEAVQRKNTPEDESRLEGKIAVANNGEDYTDLTALSRFGLRQIPIVGTPIVNRAIPYKKQSDADAGKSTTGNAGLDELTKAKEKQSADLKNAFSKEDWKLYNLSKADRQKLVSNGTYSQEKIDGLMKYGKAKEAELGYGATSTDITAKTPTSAKSILETYDSLDTEARKKWNTEKNTNAAVTKSLQAWLGDKVKIPEVTNDVAKEWADFQNDYADGKISKLKENDQKKAILKKAFNSQLSTDEKEIHTLTKTELQYYYDNGVITDENINKAIAVEKQLFDAGLIAKETLQRNLGSSARGYKTSSGSSGRKTSTKTASKASIAELLASQKQINDINNSTYLSLSKLLGSVTSGSSKMAKNKIGREVTLKKITGAKA